MPDPTPADGQDPAGTQDPADGQDPAGTEPGGDPAGGSDPAPSGSGSGQDPETFDREYVEGLRREAAERRTKATELETRLGELEASHRTALDEVTAARTAAEDRATTAERRLERIEVAIAKKLPLEFAERLQGDDREALEKDADRLAALVKPAPDFDGGPRTPAPGGKSMNDLIREKAGLAAGAAPQ